MLGICNGFQILCEAGLLPGVLRPNESLRFVCRDVRLTVVRDDPPFTSRCSTGQRLVIPVKHGEGCWYADRRVYDELEARRPDRAALRASRVERLASHASPASATRPATVIGLMPHPEHAVDPLLGSDDGALILASLVEAARVHAVAAA